MTHTPPVAASLVAQRQPVRNNDCTVWPQVALSFIEYQLLVVIAIDADWYLVRLLYDGQLVIT